MMGRMAAAFAPSGPWNIHQWLGLDRCANARCQAELSTDHVTLTTTAHVRRFCCVEHIAEGQAAWNEVVYRAQTDGSGEQAALHAIFGPPLKDRTGPRAL